jgi:hypothetical protein
MPVKNPDKNRLKKPEKTGILNGSDFFKASVVFIPVELLEYNIKEHE